MSPRRLLDELLEEERGADRRASATAHIFQIGDRRLQLIAILAREWHAPHELARALRSAFERASKLIGRRPQPSIPVSECDDASAGERRDVHDGIELGGAVCAAERLRIHERVCEGEPTLRVRVENFDRLVVRCGEDVTWAHGALAHHVLARRDDEMHLDASGLERADGAGCSEHSTRAAHVELHLLDHRARARLEVVPTRVEREAFSYECDALAHLSIRRRVREMDELGRLDCTLRHA
mmetsp:Transcript_7103/g.18207  ORF Transcript_7103/g.18207 Transcript_7103/m.18207 type:complete len:239 (-) Transcript_7103:817-1533(-)